MQLEKKAYNFDSLIKRLCATLLVRLKYIKRVPFQLDEVNLLIQKQLPQNISLQIPGGTGELSILEVSLSILTDKNCLHAEALCNFNINVKQTEIYNTHLQLIFEVLPEYSPEKKVVFFSGVKVMGINLISDQYSLMRETGSLINRLLPQPLKSIISVTLSSTQLLLNNKAVNQIVKYLSLYSSGSKQVILDYHRSEIENEIVNLAQSEIMQYHLNQSIFEEKLFAQYGESISIENSQLYLNFYS